MKMRPPTNLACSRTLVHGRRSNHRPTNPINIAGHAEQHQLHVPRSKSAHPLPTPTPRGEWPPHLAANGSRNGHAAVPRAASPHSRPQAHRDCRGPPAAVVAAVAVAGGCRHHRSRGRRLCHGSIFFVCSARWHPLLVWRIRRCRCWNAEGQLLLGFVGMIGTPLPRCSSRSLPPYPLPPGWTGRESLVGLAVVKRRHWTPFLDDRWPPLQLEGIAPARTALPQRRSPRILRRAARFQALRWLQSLHQKRAGSSCARQPRFPS